MKYMQNYDEEQNYFAFLYYQQSNLEDVNTISIGLAEIIRNQSSGIGKNCFRLHINVMKWKINKYRNNTDIFPVKFE